MVGETKHEAKLIPIRRVDGQRQVDVDLQALDGPTAALAPLTF